MEDKDLERGRRYEQKAMALLSELGYIVVPLCDGLKLVDGRGPMVMLPTGETYTSPDLYVQYAGQGEPRFGLPRCMLVDVKSKTEVAYYRNRNLYVSGIDIHHCMAYREVAAALDIDVWILHWIKTSPNEAVVPPGVYMHCIDVDTAPTDGNDTGGLVFWEIKRMKRIAGK